MFKPGLGQKGGGFSSKIADCPLPTASNQLPWKHAEVFTDADGRCYPSSPSWLCPWVSSRPGPTPEPLQLLMRRDSSSTLNPPRCLSSSPSLRSCSKRSLPSFQSFISQGFLLLLLKKQNWTHPDHVRVERALACCTTSNMMASTTRWLHTGIGPTVQ